LGQAEEVETIHLLAELAQVGEVTAQETVP
jgi:hypothetical protein